MRNLPTRLLKSTPEWKSSFILGMQRASTLQLLLNKSSVHGLKNKPKSPVGQGGRFPTNLTFFGLKLKFFALAF